jgi:hypothetical protein
LTLNLHSPEGPPSPSPQIVAPLLIQRPRVLIRLLFALTHIAGPNPNNGKADTTDHDPIHPLKHAAPAQLDADEAKVYEIVVRSFLACLSRDAKGHDTTVMIDIAGENFTAKGTQILDRGFLEVRCTFAESVVAVFCLCISRTHTKALALCASAPQLCASRTYGFSPFFSLTRPQIFNIVTGVPVRVLEREHHTDHAGGAAV